MEGVKHSVASLQTMRAIGIAIDDFRAGISTLSDLATLPLPGRIPETRLPFPCN